MRLGSLVPDDLVIGMILAGRTVLIRRSWEKDRTKGGTEDRLFIPEELVPHLEAAMDSSSSRLVFPGADGALRKKTYPLEDKLRRACARAGLVTHYELRCRRKGCGHIEVTKAAVEGKKCPMCNFTLWCKAIPRNVTPHDLRHTAATLALDGGADIRGVQAMLRHKDANTSNRYTHRLGRVLARTQATLTFPAVDPQTPRPGMEVAVDLGGAPEVRPVGSAKEEGRGHQITLRDRGLQLSGRLDLNQRPLAPQVRQDDQSSDAESRKVLQSGGVPEEASSMLSPGSAGFRRSSNAPVMQAGDVVVGPLLTVKEAAERLKVSTATVYALCESGRLAFVRISTHAIRLALADLEGYVRGQRSRGAATTRAAPSR
jgi:excisionase family DNA binding protein